MLILAIKPDHDGAIAAISGREVLFSLESEKDGGTGEPLRDTLRLFGSDCELFSSTHERSHIAMACGMAPADDARQRAVLVWEGSLGSVPGRSLDIAAKPVVAAVTG